MFADLATFEDWLAIRCGPATRVAAPAGFKQKGGLSDPSNMLVREIPPDALDLSGLVLGIVYQDDLQEETSRLVRARRCWKLNGIGYLTGFCLLRSEPRLFRIDRMREVIDQRTGEIFSNCEAFFADLGLSETDPNRRLYLARVRDGLRILMAAAFADKNVFDDEIQAALSYADRLASDMNVVLNEKDFKKIQRVANSIQPDSKAAADALGRIIEDSQHAKEIIFALRDLLNRDDRYTIEEKDAMKGIIGIIKKRRAELR